MTIAEIEPAPEDESAPVEVIVRRYGLRDPIDWGDDCEAQITKQVDLWNVLVGLSRENTAALQAITTDDPAVARLERQIAELEPKVAEAVARRKAAKARRAVERKRGVKLRLVVDADDGFVALREELRTLRASLKEERRRVREQRRPAIERLNAEIDAKVTAARQAAAADGLWWGHYNAVIDSFRRARDRVLKLRAKGKSADLHPQRYGGRARLTNQIQGGMSVDRLFAGTHAQVRVARLPSDRQGNPADYTTITATVYSTGRGGERRTVTWPMKMERTRPLPEDASIKIVTITREPEPHNRRGYRWHAIFTCTRPAQPKAAPAGRPVAVDLGWRRMNDGLRVATVLRDERGQPEWITLDNRWLDTGRYIEEIRGERDRLANEAMAQLRTLPWDEAPASLREQWQHMAAVPNAGSRALARLCFAWRAQREDGCRGHVYDGCWRPHDLAQLDYWRANDRTAWEAESRLRLRMARRRKTIYQEVARRIVDGASVVLFDALDLRQAAALPRDGSDPDMPDAARRYRVLASVNELRHWIKLRAAKLGVPVVTLDETSMVCWHCGSPRADDEKLVVTCRSCGAGYDQDVNDCRWMLRRWRERSGGASGTGSARGGEAA